jgi:hypothetical protein
MVSWLIYCYCFTSRSRIFHQYEDVTIASTKLRSMRLALRAFELGGIFIVPHLLWHGATIFPVSSEGPPHSVTSYDIHKRSRNGNGSATSCESQRLTSPGSPLSGTPQGKRQEGRPKQTWRRSTDAETRGRECHAWVKLKRASENRVRWRSVWLRPYVPWGIKRIIVCLFVYSHTSNFSAIWWLSPMPVTGLQI